MKKINLVFATFAMPISSLTLLPIVSCGEKQEVTPTINKGAHINGAEVSKVYLKEAFTIELTGTDTGWNKIDSAKTSILIGDNPVAFTMLSNTKIKVDGSVVTNSKIEINLVAGKTVNTIWAGLDTAVTHDDYSYEIVHVGQKIEVTTDESQPKGLNVWLLYGSYSKTESENDWRSVNIGSGNGQYKLYKGSEKEDITSIFATSGHTFLETELNKTTAGKYKPTPMPFEVVYTEKDEYGSIKVSNWSISTCLLTKELIKDECQIFADKTEVEQGSTAWMDATVNEGALNKFTYAITSDPNNTGSTIEYGEFKAGTAATGTVTITGTSVDKVNGNPITLSTTINVVSPK